MSNQPIALENLFNADFYRANNPDLRNFDNQRVLQHWRDFGIAEGRRFSPLVDINFYRDSNGDLASFNNRQLFDHLANFGINEGRVFSPFVNLNLYRANNGDLASFNNRQLLDHLGSFGINEGRSFSPCFDFNFYRAKNSDLTKLNNRQLFDHLTSYGVDEGRVFSPFIDLKFYRDSNPDLVGNNRQRFNQLLNYGINEGRAFSPFIDLNFYRASNSDLANLSNRQLFNHLMDWGINEGRNFSPFIDLNFYRANNRDLAGFNNRQLWEHFINYGFDQGRIFSPIPYSVNTGYGLVNASAAVAAAIGQSPFPDVPNLVGFSNWDLNKIKAPEAWSRGYTGQGVVVAVVDSGVDYRHSDLDSNIWTNTREIPGNGLDDDGNGKVDDVRGWDFVNNDNDPIDTVTDGHGTRVAGIIAAENNGFGATGVAPNAKIMPVRVVGQFGVTEDNVAAGIRYAADNGADVINISLGGETVYPKAAQAIRYAVEKGAVVVMGAGNDGGTMPLYPARYATHFGIAVGAVGSFNNDLTYFSNRAGTTPLDYVTAPGFAVYSTLPGNQYGSKNGTSFAAPHVSGVAALILSANPNLSPVQVERIITANANSNRSGFSLANSTNETREVTALSASFDSVTGELIEPESNNLRSSDRLTHPSVFDVGETAISTESFANASTTIPFNSIPIDADMTQKSTRGAGFFEPNPLDAIALQSNQMQPNIGIGFLPRFDTYNISESDK